MPLDPQLLNLLACPDCKTDLIYRRQGHTETLICSDCHHRFAVIQGIPQFPPPKQTV